MLQLPGMGFAICSNKRIYKLRMTVVETIDCILCGSPNYSPWLRSWYSIDKNQVFEIVVCNECGLKFTNPRPTFDEIGRYYGEKYYSYRRPKENIAVTAAFKSLPGKPRFLDYGCGAGHKLIEKINEGWDAFGVEIDDNARRTGRELGLDIRAAQKNRIDFADDYFDEIHLNNVLEHLHEPVAILTEVYRCLKGGGRLWIEVPNIESYDAQLYGPLWRHLDVPLHLNHFAPDTLDAMLRQCGFDEIQTRTSDIPPLNFKLYYIKGLYTVLKKYYFSKVGPSLLRLTKGLYFVLSRYIKYIFHRKTKNSGALLQVLCEKGETSFST